MHSKLAFEDCRITAATVLLPVPYPMRRRARHMLVCVTAPLARNGDDAATQA